MNFKHIINLIDVRESQAFAFMVVYKDKISEDDLQKAIDSYCDNMADSLIKEHQEFFNNEKERNLVKKYLLNLNANKKYTGRRFHETFYKKLIEFENQCEQCLNK